MTVDRLEVLRDFTEFRNYCEHLDRVTRWRGEDNFAAIRVDLCDNRVTPRRHFKMQLNTPFWNIASKLWKNPFSPRRNIGLTLRQNRAQLAPDSLLAFVDQEGCNQGRELLLGNFLMTPRLARTSLAPRLLGRAAGR